MGERGGIQRYIYWSDRRIRDIASDNDISLGSASRWTFKSPAIPFLPSFEFGREAREARRAEIARRIENSLGMLAVRNFVTPPVALFAKGVGNISFSRFAGMTTDDMVVLHTKVISSTGTRVDVCMFGSKDNLAGYVRSDDYEAGWSSSAAYAIEDFLRSNGVNYRTQWDDPESLAVEALKIARYQGETGEHKEHMGRPWSRGFSLGHSDETEWLAQVYSDVILDKDRWGDIFDVDRILIAAPVWVRTPGPQAVTLYRDIRRQEVTGEEPIL